MQQLYIVRHGQTEWNVEGRMQGRYDSPLTQQGREQARANGALIKTLGGVDQLLVSPSGRTTETAYLINSYAQAPLDFADELMERDCGEWSGLTIDEIEERYPQAWAARESDPFWYKPPEGENLNDMGLRVESLLSSLSHLGVPRIALVTHGVMSKVILKFFLALGEVECVRVRHPNDLVYRLTFHPERIETEHFTGGHSMKFSGLMQS